MRLKTIVRSAVAGAASLALALGLTACSRDYTVAYVYAVSAQTGNVSAYGVDFQTGILTQISGSPFTTNLTNPSKVIAAPNNKFVYVIGGSQNAQVVEMAVGTDGKLYAGHTYDLTGTYPTNAAIDSTGTFLYVTYTYQSGYSPASPGPGGVTIFPINQSDNTLGTPINLKVGNNPVAVAVSTPVCVASPIVASNPTCSNITGGGSGVYNTYVYVVDQEASPNATILGYAQNMTTGALTPLSGTTFNATLNTFQGYSAGVIPSAIAIDGTARFVYVTDREQNEVLGYQIARSTTGNLTALSGSPFGTGAYPVGITIDPRSDYVYTANFNSPTVSQFAIVQATGNLSTVASNSFGTAAGTTCVTIDPALGQYMYTSNYTAGDISAGTINAGTGAVTTVADSPFPTAALPTCIVAVANGEHASQVLQP